MGSILTEPVASTITVLDETGGATLSEIARATGKPVSTVQRAVARLVESGVIEREGSRGRLRFAAGSPRRALRELADWRLGRPRGFVPIRDGRGGQGAAPVQTNDVSSLPFRRALTDAIDSIVSEYRPARVILFGSHALGTAGPESDVDLLVVFDDDRDRRERRVGLRRLLHDMPFAKDILVASTEDLRHPGPGTAIKSAARYGITVYERP